MSDTNQGQKDVEANVTVHVRLLNTNEVVHASPVTLAAGSHSVVRRDTKVRHGEGEEKGHEAVLNLKEYIRKKNY